MAQQARVGRRLSRLILATLLVVARQAALQTPRVVRMYLDVSISTPSVNHPVDDVLCGSQAEVQLHSGLASWVRLPLDRVPSSSALPSRTASTKKVADTIRPRVTTSAAASTWVKPVTVTCPTLAKSKDLKVVMESTEDDANRYCVSVCGVGSWCKCDAAEGQPRICQHGLLQQCGYRLCDCSQLCGDRNGRRRLSQQLRYEGSVQFQVERPSQADRVLEVIRYNLSGLDIEINSGTEGGLVRPAVVPVLEVLDPSKPLTMNPDYLTTITATIYLEVLPQWQPSIMAAPLALAVKTFFRTRLARAEVAVRSGVLVTARVNETTPRAMTELLIDQDAFLDAVRLALGPGVSVGHSFPSLLVYIDESGGSSPAPKDTAVKETTFTILLIVILTAATVGCAVACCVIFKIVAQYKRSGAPRDFELGKAGEIASSRADEETTLDTTSISYVLPARSITMSDTCLSLEGDTGTAAGTLSSYG
ncbi:hypothetical protein FOL46_008279 [Perkinsus olseni]|uniref:Uncharacterized protein n=1 Tax=Perkinsus olseni TaxID=32597 RepID=A0A7J6L849_PEROL|nr:hypothetical protein FOL46_008279 [Perkinsus olseni]